MATINLLPWREEYREQKKKEFFIQLGVAAAIAALVAFGWVRMANASLENQQSRNNLLKQEISSLEKQVEEIKDLKQKKQQLNDRIEVIMQLQGTRPLIVRYFDELAKSVPDGVYLTSVKRNGKILDIAGISESNNRVSSFLRQLSRSDFFDSPNLSSVTNQTKVGEKAKSFVISLSLVEPRRDGDEE